MPRTFPASLAVLAALALHSLPPLANARAEEDAGKFLNFVVFDLPPKYFADIPLNQRAALLKALSTWSDDHRLDYQNNYLHWYADGGDISASSQLWVKLFPRDYGRVQHPYSPYVFVHMAKPFAHGSAPAENQSFVLNWKNESWEDVTEKVLPKGLDRKLHLRPERNFFGIRVFEYEEIERNDGLGKAYTISNDESALYVWQDNGFREQTLLPFNSEHEAPFDPQKLALLTLTSDFDERELAERIIHAGLAKDDRFRHLLASEKLNSNPLLAMALASYRYALDQDPEAIDFIVRQVAEEGRGDTNSLWIMSYFDEWDKTIEAYDQYSGGDGAAAEAAYLWMETRKAFYPEKFKEWTAKRKQENR